ncbi:ubiquitin-conjugating enzyme family protein [Naegleria gruberi]|uniref:Ubiquitin-conjugating enzyme family protein n=1 Tax=Naegleria gruberi TaxID=5762 RepID=D2VD59_NAEGR|nr:ubiquitin-conjugating enzyme family protein [Naegleria gruberi]EFC45274.1 ubiquitin-conjugating enzyme family protein [Naegleria gruberi]|eukprot:XP_002678018.1 ubiquitin-conjugating enzyme family protein [Naegleria gruberi strain NEG-M]
MNSSSSKALPSSALKRITRDLKEIQSNPLETVYAEPFQGDMFHWYATVLAPKTSKYHGIIVVLDIKFPKDYPNEPPQIACLTQLHHSHVFGGWICLDMLKAHYFDDIPYMGWSTSYSCLSILLQLQSFLLEEEDRQERYIQSDIDASRKYVNSTTGHNPTKGTIYPCAPYWNVSEILASKYVPQPVKAVVLKKDKPVVKPVPKKETPKTVEPKVETKPVEPKTIAETKPVETKPEPKAVPVNTNAWDIPFQYVDPTKVVAKKEEQPKPSQDEAKDPNYIGKNKKKKLNRLKKVQEKMEKKKSAVESSTIIETASPAQPSKNLIAVSMLKKTPEPKKHLKDLPNELILHTLSYLNIIELKRVEQSSKYLYDLCEHKFLSTARELVCFHSKETFNEDTLGVGLSFETKKDGTIASISTPLDLLSHTSFYKENVRKSVWGRCFSHWIPVFINRKHGNFEILKQSVMKIQIAYPSISSSESLDNATIYIELMCKLMNTMVVEIMKGNTHASIKALYGYMYFHRWLIYLIEKFPQALDRLKYQVNQFKNSESARLKSSCPNLGEFLPKLSVLGPSKLTWNSIKTSVVEETSIRNALWVIKMHPGLARFNEMDSERCIKSWEANQVSCKLIMFHVFFLRNIVEEYSDLSLEEFGRLYDTNFGCPPKTKSGELLEDVLQREVFKIQNVSSFKQYFDYVGIGTLYDNSSIAKYLRDCVNTSARRGYHSSYGGGNNNSYYKRR